MIRIGCDGWKGKPLQSTCLQRTTTSRGWEAPEQQGDVSCWASVEDKAVEGCGPRLHIFWKAVRTSAGKALSKIGHLSEDTGLRTDFDLTPLRRKHTLARALGEKKFLTTRKGNRLKAKAYSWTDLSQCLNLACWRNDVCEYEII